MASSNKSISKLSAAESQLKEAIRLFFEKRDAVSIHTLVGAAHQILFDIGKKKRVQSILKDNQYIRPEKKKEWHRALDKAKSFFKHADRDYKKSIVFNPDSTSLLLIDALSMYQQLTDSLFHEGAVFLYWYMGMNPRLFKEGVAKDFIKSAKDIGVDFHDFEKMRDLLELKI